MWKSYQQNNTNYHSLKKLPINYFKQKNITDITRGEKASIFLVHQMMVE